MPSGDWRTLREIDEQLSLPKGSAFRAFKRASLQQPAEVRVLVRGVDDAELQALHAAGRCYRSSVNVILLSPGAAASLAASLAR